MNKGKKDMKDDERGDKKRMKIGSKKLMAETKASFCSSHFMGFSWGLDMTLVRIVFGEKNLSRKKI